MAVELLCLVLAVPFPPFSDALSGTGRHDDADAAVRNALQVFEEVEFGVGLTEARKAGLRCARAAGDKKRISRYESMLSSLSARGGAGGLSIGSMSAGDLYARVQENMNRAPVGVLEITRSGDRLKFENLLDGSSVEHEIEYTFRNVCVSGILFQVRGAEIQLVDIYSKAEAPGTKGETAMTVGGKVVHTGPDFAPFGQRSVVSEGFRLRVTSAVQLVRSKQE